MAVTKAFDRYRNRTTVERGATTTFDRYRKVEDASTATQRTGIVSGLWDKKGEAWDKVKSATAEYLEEEREIRARSTAAQDFKRTFYTKPKAIIKFLAQGLGSAGLAVGRTMQEGILTPFVGKQRAREATQGGQEIFGKNFDQILAGEDRVKSYQEMKKNVDDYLAVSEVATPWEQKYLGGTLAFGLFAMDAWPGKPKPKKQVVDILKDLIEIKDEDKVVKRLVDAGISDDIATRVAPKVAEANSEDAVRKVIQEEAADALGELFDASRKGDVAPTGVGRRAVDEEPPTVDKQPIRFQDTNQEKVVHRLVGDGDSIGTDLMNSGDLFRATTDTGVDSKYFTEKLDRVIAFLTKAEDGTVHVDDSVGTLKAQKPEEYQALVSQWDQQPVTSRSEELAKGINQKILQEDYTGAKELADELKIEWGKAQKTVNETPTPRETVTVGNKTTKVNGDLPPEAKVKADPDETKAIRDLAQKDGTKLQSTKATMTTTPRNLAKEVESNINKYNTKMKDKEIADIREQNLLNPETIDEIILRKRGVVTDAESIERAKQIQGTLEDVINLPKGTAVTKEQMDAVRQIVQREREINKTLINIIDNGGTASSKAERTLIKNLGKEYENLSDHELLVRALEENTYKLKKAEIVELALGSEAARTLQSLNRVVDSVDHRLRVLYNKLNKAKHLDTDAKQAMVEQIARLDTKDNKAFIKTLEEMVKPDMFDKVAEWSVAAKLWNPTTHAVNLGGNFIRGMVDLGIKTVTNPMAARADWHGAAVGFKQGMKNAFKAFTDDGYAAMLSKYLETGGSAPAIKGKLGTAVRTPFRALAAGDELFKSVAYQRSLHRSAYRQARKEGLKGKQRNRRMEEILNRPDLKMQEKATNEAKRMTFQEEMGDVMKKINQIRDPQAFASKTGKAAATGIRMFLPFLKTPTNLFKQAVDMSPLGVAKNWKKLRKAAKEGDQEAVGTILGEAIFGTAVATYIAMETLDGNVTGGAPRDSAKKDAFYREKKLPYAIKIGDTWVQYKRVDPFASLIGLTADVATLEDKADMGAVAGVIAENMKDKTYLSGMSDLMKVLTGEDWERDYAVKSMVLGGALPSFMGHTTRAMDPNIRRADTLGQRLLVQIPGMSESFPTRVNVLGYDVERANKGLNYFFNPIQMESAEIDPVTEQLMDINKTIAVPQDYFYRDGVRYEFTETEYEDYARYVGIALRYDLMELFDSSKYKNATTDEKDSMIDTLRRKIQTAYKDEYVEERQTGGLEDDMRMFENFVAGRPLDAEPAGDIGEQFRNYFLGQ